MKLILTADTPWSVSDSLSEAVKRAVRDLRNDWYSVFGCPPLFHDVKEGARIIIGGDCPLQERESYSVYIKDNAVVISGADELGLIYGIYTFSENVLGVDPWSFWNDFPPLHKDKIELDSSLTLSHGTPTFKYRGFFINNEDMMSGSFPDPLRENTMSLQMFEKICELILRLKGNIIAPGTRVYPDETARDLAAIRGLYVNDHHVTPLGLNVYMWPEDVPYSYVTHPEIFEGYWKQCVDAQKHRKMLWTVGFRGKGDASFWNFDKNAPASEAERAEIISRAVAKQVELIREVQPDADIIFNMYHEQAVLCAKGLLKIPDNVIRVWPNDGAGIMSDEGNAASGDGAYFHITACRNRFCEAVSPERVYSELGRYVNAGATSCLVMNVGNIRHFPISIGAVMDFVYDPKPFMVKSPSIQMEERILDYAKKHYDCRAEDVAELYIKFLRCSNFRRPRPDRAPFGYGSKCLGLYDGMWDASENQVLIDFRQNLYMHEIARQFIRVLQNESEFTEIWRLTVNDFEAVLHEPEAYLPELSRKAHALECDIPKRSKDLFNLNVLAQIDMTNNLNNTQSALDHAVLDFMEGRKEEAAFQIERAIVYLETGLDAFHNAETTKWPYWFSYEALSCYWHTRDLLRAVLSLLKGENPVPVRPFIDFAGHGRQVNAYQFERGNAYFPFLKKP